MPLPGGDADKTGNRYEGFWTVYCMTRILHEDATSIHLEPVGAEGQGVEFVLTLADGHKEYHQVKRQHGIQGPWTLNNLFAERVLNNFWNKLERTDNHCVFVSASSADELRELTERAKTARNADEYRNEFAKARQVAAIFDNLCQKWGEISDEVAYDALKRIRTETVSEEHLFRDVEFRLSTLVIGEAEAAIDVLAALALDSINQELTALEIWQRLKERGIQRCIWHNDPHVLAAVTAANERYLRPIQLQAITGNAIPRGETQDVIGKLEQGSKKAILVSGDAGTGKSGVAAEVLCSLSDKGWFTLALRMDRLNPVETVRQIGEQMGLPDSPPIVLGGLSHGRKSLLVIDQLDAVSTSSGRNPHFFERVQRSYTPVRST